jgi:hypothetical protein
MDNNLIERKIIDIRTSNIETKKLNDGELKIIKDYADCLSVERASNFNSWIEVGWCLHNIDERLLDKWIEFSKKARGYELTADTNCRQKWDEMSDEGLGIGNLKMWARQDNKEQYLRILQYDLRGQLEKVGNLGKAVKPYDIAEIMYKIYGHLHICLRIRHQIWFYYDSKKHRWVYDDKGLYLEDNISTEVYTKFKELADYHSGQSLESGDESFRKAESMRQVMHRLKDIGFKENIMNECRKLFSKNTDVFIEYLDKNESLICFNNGVYNLQNRTLRDGRPEDYISYYLNIDCNAYILNVEKERLQSKLKNTIFKPDELVIYNYNKEYLKSIIDSINKRIDIFYDILHINDNNNDSNDTKSNSLNNNNDIDINNNISNNDTDKQYGIVYLIQPGYLIGTNRYKVGFSNSLTIDRVKIYGKDVLLIRILKCNEPKLLDKKIIEHFKEKFKLINGNEWFEIDGDEKVITYEFDVICRKHNYDCDN